MNQKSFDVEIVTPEGISYSGKADKFYAPGYEGYFEILYNHTPYIVTLQIGEIRLTDGNKDIFFSTSGGFAEINNNKVIILAETAIKAEEIDVERAKLAKYRAEKRLRTERRNIDVTRAELALKRAINRIKVSGRIK